MPFRKSCNYANLLRMLILCSPYRNILVYHKNNKNLFLNKKQKILDLFFLEIFNLRVNLLPIFFPLKSLFVVQFDYNLSLEVPESGTNRSEENNNNKNLIKNK